MQGLTPLRLTIDKRHGRGSPSNGHSCTGSKHARQPVAKDDTPKKRRDGGSDFKEDALTPKEQIRNETDGDKGEGKGK
jgi:hypothetical protein